MHRTVTACSSGLRPYAPSQARARGHLTAYAGEAADLLPDVLEGYLEDVASGAAPLPVWKVFDLEAIREAHALMEDGSARGKIVVTTGK